MEEEKMKEKDPEIKTKTKEKKEKSQKMLTVLNYGLNHVTTLIECLNFLLFNFINNYIIN